MKAKKYTCIKCGKEINEIYPYPGNQKTVQDQNRLWHGGVVFTIQAGYGSEHDGFIFNGALCDKCIDTMASEGKIKFVRDYLFGNKKYIPSREDEER
jgi:hypothetical protein